MGKWHGWPLVRRDVEAAEAAIDRGELLEARAWAAMIWKWTGVSTGWEQEDARGRYLVTDLLDPHTLDPASGREKRKRRRRDRVRATSSAGMTESH